MEHDMENAVSVWIIHLGSEAVNAALKELDIKLDSKLSKCIRLQNFLISEYTAEDFVESDRDVESDEVQQKVAKAMFIACNT